MTERKRGIVEFGYFEAGCTQGVIEVVDVNTGVSIRKYKVKRSEYLKRTKPDSNGNLKDQISPLDTSLQETKEA